MPAKAVRAFKEGFKADNTPILHIAGVLSQGDGIRAFMVAELNKVTGGVSYRTMKTRPLETPSGHWAKDVNSRGELIGRATWNDGSDGRYYFILTPGPDGSNPAPDGS